MAVTGCTGSVANGAPISTATVGNFQFTVTGTDADGGSTTVTRDYSVKANETTPGGETPATLNLTLGTPSAFTPFVPGVARDYTTTLSAAILTTAENATQSDADASSSQPPNVAATGLMSGSANFG